MSGGRERHGRPRGEEPRPTVSPEAAIRALAIRRRVMMLVALAMFGVSTAIIVADPQRGQAHGGPFLALWLGTVATLGLGGVVWYRRATDRLAATGVVDRHGVPLGRADRVATQAVQRRAHPCVTASFVWMFVAWPLELAVPGEGPTWWVTLLATVVAILTYLRLRTRLRRAEPELAALRLRDLA